VLIAGAFAPIQEAHAQSNAVHSEKQQQIGQSANCRNNVTCTDIGLISFVTTPNQEKNVTKLNLGGQANLVQKDTTPFLLPFP
jgi:hypothetical protein